MASYLDETNLRALWGLATCNMVRVTFNVLVGCFSGAGHGNEVRTCCARKHGKLGWLLGGYPGS